MAGQRERTAGCVRPTGCISIPPSIAKRGSALHSIGPAAGGNAAIALSSSTSTQSIARRMQYGLTAPETADAERSVDAAIGDLHSALAAMGQPANLVIVSDHGMAQVDPDRTSDLDTLLPSPAYRLASYGPFATIDPGRARGRGANRAARPHATCNAGRTTSRHAIAMAAIRASRLSSALLDGGEVMPGRPTNKGDHGFDPDDPDMAALFIAAGPGIATKLAGALTSSRSIHSSRDWSALRRWRATRLARWPMRSSPNKACKNRVAKRNRPS